MVKVGGAKSADCFLFVPEFYTRLQKMALHSAVKGKLMAVIGDEDTCVGFLLGGIGEINKNRQSNFLVVDKSELT